MKGSLCVNDCVKEKQNEKHMTNIYSYDRCYFTTKTYSLTHHSILRSSSRVALRRQDEFSFIATRPVINWKDYSRNVSLIAINYDIMKTYELELLWCLAFSYSMRLHHSFNENNLHMWSDCFCHYHSVHVGHYPYDVEWMRKRAYLSLTSRRLHEQLLLW